MVFGGAVPGPGAAELGLSRRPTPPRRLTCRAAPRQRRPHHLLVDVTHEGEPPEQTQGVAMPSGPYGIIGAIVAIIVIFLLLRLLGVI